MIIGISGKIGSGKDTVGQIIQYLTLPEEFSKTNKDIEADLEHKGYCASKSNWKIKKFADKLKDIVCLLIGCTREQLEDREFKEKELGEEWWYYVIQLNQSKSLVSYLETRQELRECTLVKLTPRLLLQLLGTEAGRQIIHPNIWVNALFCEYKRPKYQKVKSYKEEPDSSKAYTTVEGEYPNWIITDLRFPNEAKAIKDKGGILIRINRVLNESEKKEIVDLSTIHISETALDDYQDWDYVIDNNGTIEELIEKVREILIKEGVK